MKIVIKTVILSLISLISLSAIGSVILTGYIITIHNQY